MGWTVRGSTPGGRARFFAHVQTGHGAHPDSCTMGTGSFPRVELYLYPPSRPVQACNRNTLPFLFSHKTFCQAFFVIFHIFRLDKNQMVLSSKNYVMSERMIQYIQHIQRYWVPDKFPDKYDNSKLQCSVHKNIFIMINNTQYYSDN
jgi:hypothetical protein